MVRPFARRAVAAALAGSLLLASGTALSASPSGQSTSAAPIAAKWVHRKIHFLYSAVSTSEKTFYSCDKLQSEITTMLRDLGARNEVVKSFGCMSNGGPERFPGVDATFSVLEPAAGSEQASATSSDSIAATWDKVTLSSDASCDLIEQVKRRILPLFTTRNQSSGCSPRFGVEVLRPVKSSTTQS